MTDPDTNGPPPDRSDALTEQRNPDTLDLHRRSVRECLRALQREDRRAVEAVALAEDALAALIEAAEPGFVRGGRLVYLGAGTSGRLGVLDASEAPPTFDVERGRVVGLIAGGDRALRTSSESAEDDPEGARAELEALAPTADDTFVAIAAGGSTPYALGGIAIAKALAPAAVTALVCCTRVRRPPGCDHVVEVSTGPEVLTGSTRMKAGTATKLVLNALSTTLMVRAGRVFENLMVDLRATNAKLTDRAARIVAELVPCDRATAFERLRAANGGVKLAIVMGRLGLDARAAAARLEAAGGRLDRVLESN
jgi:N-acetylmuramic acid 6-phosphate etherase